MDEVVKQRLQLFPVTATLHQLNETSYLSIAGCNLASLADQYSTPLYIYDRATMDQAVQHYRNALNSSYPASSGITYAGKAYLCKAIAQWTQQQGLWLDCTGIGELAIAETAGVPRASILVHGVNKSFQDLKQALKQAGTVVVDNTIELKRISGLADTIIDPLPNLWLRLRPGIAVETHSYRQTGQDDSKFGMSPAEIIQSVRFCLENNLPLTGLHFHLGSHFHDPSPLGPAIEMVVDLLAAIKDQTGWFPQTLCTGGGWGIPYHEQDLPHPSIEGYVAFICQGLVKYCREHGLPLPHLQVEPGRSLVARAGVAIYQVGAVKDTAGRHWLLLDGGIADNPRPALYGAQYSALPIRDLDRPIDRPTWLAGPYCESGDILIEALPMPVIQPGEWIAIPASGAYHLSMSSNYNGARKPAVVWLDQGRDSLIQRRETPQDLHRRDFALPESIT